MNKKYYVISDSHSRTFSYSAKFIPLFIGPGKDNLFLTREQYETTKNKIIEVIARLNKKIPIIFVLNEPNIRFYLDQFKPCFSSEKHFIKTLVKRQVELFAEISKQRKLIISTAIPKADKKYAKLALAYSNFLKRELAKNKIPCIDIFDACTDNNHTIKKQYIGDFIHGNHKLADTFLSLLGEKRKNYTWQYKYKFPYNERRSFYIWGDFPKKDLVYKKTSPRNWSQYGYLTRATLQTVEIITLCKEIGAVKSLFIFNLEEGFIPFRIDDCELTYYSTENAIEKKRNLEILNRNNSNIRFVKKFKKSDIVVITDDFYRDGGHEYTLSSNLLELIIVKNGNLEAWKQKVRRKTFNLIPLNEKYSLLVVKGDIPLKTYQEYFTAITEYKERQMYENLKVNNPAPSTILARLKKYGIAIVPSYVDAKTLTQLRKEFDDFFTSPHEAIFLKHKHATNVNGKVARVKRKQLDMEFPATKELFGSEFMDQIVKSYYAPYDYTLNDDIFITHEKPCETPILPWHYDRQQSLKFFVYLKDTTKKDGAFEYCPGSHREGRYRASYHLLKGVKVKDLPNDIPDDELINPVTIEGKAGDMIIFDPDGFHRGGVVAEGGERMVMRGHSHPVSEITEERVVGDELQSRADKTRDDEFKFKNRLT